ncbi:MAG: 30S ribosome-binding factor RbfA [Bryobacteraceae bacterium]
MDPRRSERLTEALRTEIDEILNYELADPRITDTAVIDVVLSGDGKKAHIRLAVDGSPAEQAECLKAIEKAKGYVRHLLTERVDVFFIPDLRFELDLTPQLRTKADSMLRRIRKGRPREAPEPESSGVPKKIL